MGTIQKGFIFLIVFVVGSLASSCPCHEEKGKTIEELRHLARKQVSSGDLDCINTCFAAIVNRHGGDKQKKGDEMLDWSAALRKMKHFKEASQILEDSIKLLGSRVSSSIYNDYALTLFDSNASHDDIIAAHEKAISIARRHENSEEVSKALYNLGTTYQRLDGPREAARAFKNATKMDPSNAKAALNWGECLAKLELHEEAIKAYKKAVDSDPDLLDAQWNTALSYLQLEQTKKAKLLLKRLAKKKRTALAAKASDLLKQVKEKEKQTKPTDKGDL